MLDEFRTHGIDPEPIQHWAAHTDPQLRRNRHQVIETFPIVAYMIASDPSWWAHEKIAAVIDQGGPLIEALATISYVKKHSVRFLRGKGPALWAEVWKDFAHDLVRAIDVLQPERRPRNAIEWKQMWELWVGCGMMTSFRFISQPTWISPKVLHQHMFTGLYALGYQASSKRLDRLWQNNRVRLNDLQDYFSYVDEWCEAIADLHQLNHLTWMTVVISVDKDALMHYSVNELIRQSKKWHSLFGVALIPACLPTHHADLVWPSLPGLPLQIGNLTVCSLTNYEQLLLEGQRLNHYVETYLSSCMHGESHIVSIRDQNGESLSTAEITLLQEADGSFTPSLVQHRGKANSDPACACIDAIKQVLLMLESADDRSDLDEIQAFHAKRKEDVDDLMERLRGDEQARMIAIMREVLPDYERAVAQLVKRLYELKDWYQYQRNARISEKINCNAICNTST